MREFGLTRTYRSSARKDVGKETDSQAAKAFVSELYEDSGAGVESAVWEYSLRTRSGVD
jgi:hypothetical protein